MKVLKKDLDKALKERKDYWLRRGQLITQIMIRDGILQQELADAVGVTRGTMSRILHGKISGSTTLPALAVALGMSYTELMTLGIRQNN